MFLRALLMHGPAVLVLVAPAARADDVGTQLSRLSSRSALERADAQRWLSAHLSLEDRAAVESATRAGGAEVRARLVEALADEDRLVGLSAVLAASADADCAALGREALVESIERWSPGSKKPGVGQSESFEALRKDHDRTILLDAQSSSAQLELVLDLVLRACSEQGRDGAPAIAIDPRCAPVEPRPRPVEDRLGPLDSVLSDLVARRGLTCHGFGFGDESEGARWIVVLPREAEAPASATQLVARWSIAVAGAGETPARAGAARALAASGWPAGIAWLAERWVEHDDGAALEGVLLAARRGRVAPQLLGAGAQARLRAELERALSSGVAGSARGIAIATALGATGAIGARGEDLIGPALSGLPALQGRALWARLVELEQRVPAGTRAIEALKPLVSRADAEPASAWLALSMLSRAGGDAPDIAPDPIASGLIGWCAARDRLEELFRILRGQPSFPPDAWRDPRGVPQPGDVRVRALVTAAWLARGSVDVAAQHIEAAVQSADPAARETFALALLSAAKDVGAEPVRLAFERAIADAGTDPIVKLRVAAIAGAAGTDALAGRVLSSLPEVAVAREDALALAALVAGPRGEEARTRMLATLKGSIEPSDAVAAADRALSELRATREEPLERAFVREARAAARDGRPELRTRLRIDAWPAPPVGEPIRIGDADRSFERAGVR